MWIFDAIFWWAEALWVDFFWGTEQSKELKLPPVWEAQETTTQEPRRGFFQKTYDFFKGIDVASKKQAQKSFWEVFRVWREGREFREERREQIEEWVYDPWILREWLWQLKWGLVESAFKNLEWYLWPIWQQFIKNLTYPNIFMGQKLLFWEKKIFWFTQYL